MNRLAKALRNSGFRLFIAVLLTATVAPQILNVRSVSADDGGYYWANATYVDANYDWGYNPCPANDTGCMAMTDNGYGTADPWVYSLRNCTSYAAWKINQVFGVTNITGWGNADTWDTGYTKAQPYPVYSPSSYTPQVGDIAQWDGTLANPAGHVAYVYAVSGGIASLDEYNAAGTGLFSSNRTTASGSAGIPSHYIHIGTPNSGSGSPARSDVDNNGCSDLVAVVPDTIGSKGFAALSTCTNGFASPQQWWDGTPYDWNGITPLVGDMNGDKKADLVYLTNEGAGGTKVFVATSNGATGFNAPQLWLNATYWPYSGIKPVLGDVDGDGCADLVIVTNEGANGSLGFVMFSNCSNGFFPPQQRWNGAPYNWNGITPMLGDVNNDKKADFVYLTNEGAGGTKAFVGISQASAHNGGFAYDQLWLNATYWPYSGVKADLGDADGDGCTDLVITTNEGANGSKAFVARSNCTNGFASVQQWWDGTPYPWDGITPLVGDVTGDGKADLVYLTNEGANGTKVFVGISQGSAQNGGFAYNQLWLNASYWAYTQIKANLQ